jgi:hypothetical protein
MIPIWGAIFIPFLTVAILLIFWRRRTKWWEAGIPLLVSALLIAGSSWIAENVGTKDQETWGAWPVEAQYYERWNEYIHKTCYNTVSCGKNCSTQVPYDCSYVSTHAARWAVHDSNKARHNISQKTYQHFVKLYSAQPTFKDLRRRFHTLDGDMYWVAWPETAETLEPITTTHRYENRVQASRSVFSYVDLTPEEVEQHGLFTYPKMSLFDYPSVLGDCGAATKEADGRLRYHNAVLGAKKQLRMWLLCFQSDDPEVGQFQESLWVGGNKNEVVVAVGLSAKGAVNWVHPFSWSDEKAPLIETRDFISEQKTLQPVEAVDFLAARLEEGFVRKQFAEFSYLTVEPPLWTIIVTYVMTLLVNVGLSYWLIHNEFHDQGGYRRSRR